MTTTPNYGWPLPDKADPLRLGAQQITDLATAVDIDMKRTEDSIPSDLALAGSLADKASKAENAALCRAALGPAPVAGAILLCGSHAAVTGPMALTRHEFPAGAFPNGCYSVVVATDYAAKHTPLVVNWDRAGFACAWFAMFSSVWPGSPASPGQTFTVRYIAAGH